MKLQSQIESRGITLLIFLVIMVLRPVTMISQPVVMIDSYLTCSNEELLIPISIENFMDVAALTLFINIDTAVVEYIDVENVNEAFSSGEFLGGINLADQFISLNWASFTAANIDSGVLCDIRVFLKDGSVDFNFSENCEIVHSDLSIVENVQYLSGTIATLSSFSPNPSSQSVIDGSPANINMDEMPDNITYQWQVYDNGSWINITNTTIYSGVQTSTLYIQSATADLNNNVYRCFLTANNCSEGSMSSVLTVMPNGLSDDDVFTKNTILNVYPNPVSEYLNCYFNSNINNGGLRLINSNGDFVHQYKLEDILPGSDIQFNLASLKSGNYILQLNIADKIIETLKITKL